jgi:hypothetical protein
VTEVTLDRFHDVAEFHYRTSGQPIDTSSTDASMVATVWPTGRVTGRSGQGHGMTTVDELMQANLMEVFNERDDTARRAAMARTYSPDVRFSDPDEVVMGHEAVNAKAQRLLDEAPSFVFRPMGPVLTNHDLGYLAWGFGPEGADPVVRGIDIALVEGGLITKIYTLLLSD